MNTTQRAIYVAVLATCCMAPGGAWAQFSIQLNYVGGVTPAQQAIFDQAAATWESYITGYQPGISLTGVTISVSTPVMPAGQLGLANATSTVNQGGFYLTSAGYMQFNSTMIGPMMDQGFFDEIVIHEMGHVLGIGIQWGLNGVYLNNSGQYTGAYGVAAYNHEYGQNGTFVPVELSGGVSTANKHWDEVHQGAALTGITDLMGRDKAHELMTGWLNIGQPPYISNTSIQSLRDIGFEVINLYPTAVPEPGGVTLAILLVGVSFLSWRRHRHSRGLRWLPGLVG